MEREYHSNYPFAHILWGFVDLKHFLEQSEETIKYVIRKKKRELHQEKLEYGGPSKDELFSDEEMEYELEYYKEFFIPRYYLNPIALMLYAICEDLTINAAEHVQQMKSEAKKFNK